MLKGDRVDDIWWVTPAELDDDQREIISSLDQDRSDLILGPPGSGKTNLLLFIANYLALRKRTNFLVVVFTRTLQEFIKSGIQHYGFDDSKVVTHRSWQQSLLFDYGVRVTPPRGKFEEQRDFYTAQISQLVERKGLGQLYQAVLLDEVQDYLPEELEVFRRLGKTIFAAGDSRQQIYAGNDGLATIRQMVDREHLLRYHYRNGKRICLLADGLAKDSTRYEPLLPTSRYDETKAESRVHPFRCSGRDEEVERVAKALEGQLKAYPKGLLAVLVPKKKSLMSVYSSLRKSAVADKITVQGEGEVISFSPETPICVCTIHAAKGLEFRAVHVVGCDELMRFGLNRNLTYTAVTRAKTSLSLYYSGKIHGYLEQAVSDLEAVPSTKPSLDQLFGRKK